MKKKKLQPTTRFSLRAKHCLSAVAGTMIPIAMMDAVALPVPIAQRIGRPGKVFMGIDSGFFEGNEVSN